MHPDAACADIFADRRFIVIAVNGIGGTIRAVHFESQPAVAERISRITAGNILLIIRPVLGF
ncbi:hypothetical protein D3C80_1901950 [compost metagenome]